MTENQEAVKAEETVQEEKAVAATQEAAAEQKEEAVNPNLRTLEVTIDGKEFTANIKADTMPSLLAGVEYEITLTVVGQEAVISSVKEVPWTTTKVDGGTIS